MCLSGHKPLEKLGRGRFWKVFRVWHTSDGKWRLRFIYGVGDVVPGKWRKATRFGPIEYPPGFHAFRNVKEACAYACGAEVVLPVRLRRVHTEGAFGIRRGAVVAGEMYISKNWQRSARMSREKRGMTFQQWKRRQQRKRRR